MDKLAHLYLAGLGIRSLEQITVETRRILRRCRTILHYGEPHAGLLELNPSVVDLSELYWTGEDRDVVYRRLVRRVMSEVRRGRGVASVTYGHPMFFDDVHAMLVRRCRREGLECRVLPAVSCLDTLCIDLGIDYGDPGLVVFEATDLVRNRRRMNGSLHTLILQVGAYDVDETTDTIAERDGMFDSLERYLLRTYPEGHRAVLCFSDSGRGGIRRAARLGRLNRQRNAILPGTTLYLPPL